jgi:hypothetical protein
VSALSPPQRPPRHGADRAGAPPPPAPSQRPPSCLLTHGPPCLPPHLGCHVVQSAGPQERQLLSLLNGQPKVTQPQLVCVWAARRHVEDGRAGEGTDKRQQ